MTSEKAMTRFTNHTYLCGETHDEYRKNTFSITRVFCLSDFEDIFSDHS